MSFRKVAVMMFSAAALTFAGAALSQDEYQQPPTEPEPVEVSDAQLEQFVAAQESITAIQQDFSGRLEGVEDPEEAYELQVQANDEMTQAVEDAGLSVEDYNQVAMAIQTDAELRERLEEMSNR